jgi:hypothetical protein
MKPNPTPGPRPRREPINLYGIRMTVIMSITAGVYGVGTFDSSQPTREPIRRALEIWYSSVNPGLRMTHPTPRSNRDADWGLGGPDILGSLPIWAIPSASLLDLLRIRNPLRIDHAAAPRSIRPSDRG